MTDFDAGSEDLIEATACALYEAMKKFDDTASGPPWDQLTEGEKPWYRDVIRELLLHPSLADSAKGH